MKHRLGKLGSDRRGATAIEYGLMLCLVALTALGGISALGGSTGGAWRNVTTKVSAVTPNP